MENYSPMDSPPSPQPSDQDDYSIPDDDLRSTSTASSYRARVPLTTLNSADVIWKAPVIPTKVHFKGTQSEKTDDDPSKWHQATLRKHSVANKKSKVTLLSPHVSFGSEGGDPIAQVDMATTGVVPQYKTADSASVGVTIHHSDSNKSKGVSVTTVLPDTENVVSPVTYYTYRAQLTFGLKTTKDVNVAQHFIEWIKNSCELLPNFSLLPFEEGEKGQQISSVAQVPHENQAFYTMYYSNHRVLQHGNLTGMVHFQCSTPWARLKGFHSRYFSWLRTGNIYLNQTKFKTDTLVACGFLLGAHPGYLRRDEAEQELKSSLDLTDSDIPFQLSSRTTSVLEKEGGKERFSFQAIIIETSTKNAAKLRERFYTLENPSKVQHQFPYTGKYQFVPFLKSKEWTVPKILQLAKLHAKTVQDLSPIFLTNLQDIRTVISDEGDTLLQGFYGMQHTSTPAPDKQPITVPLIHSVHNTGNKTTKVAIVPSAHYEEALNQFSALHDILATNIANEYHNQVFLPDTRVGITGQRIDSISSCNYSSFASQLLSTFNPQDGEQMENPSPSKRYRPVPLSYAAVVAPELSTAGAVTTATVATSLSALTSSDIDQLYEKMKHNISKEYGDNPTIKIDELERQVNISSQEIKLVKQTLDESVNTITARVDDLTTTIHKQNTIILGMQKDFQETMSEFSSRLTAIYAQSSVQQPLTPAVSTRDQRRWGESPK
jgi:hypothetical protein